MLSSRSAIASRRLLIRSSARSRKLSTDKGKFYDPQAEANARMNENMGKMSGIEAVQALPKEIHMANYATAVGLVGFVGYVFWYSMTAVGQSTGSDPLANLQSEAAEARAMKEKKEAQQRSAEELAQLDMGVSDKDLEKGITLAVAAPDAIATEEEERNKAVLKGGDGQKRSLLNKVVFFWR